MDIKIREVEIIFIRINELDTLLFMKDKECFLMNLFSRSWLIGYIWNLMSSIQFLIFRVISVRSTVSPCFRNNRISLSRR